MANRTILACHWRYRFNVQPIMQQFALIITAQYCCHDCPASNGLPLFVYCIEAVDNIALKQGERIGGWAKCEF